MEVTNPSFFGATTFGPPEAVEMPFPGDSSRKISVVCAHGEWCPPDRLIPFLPANFTVPLDCYTHADGLRRIVPRCNFEELIDLGAVGGRAVMHSLRGFDQDRDDEYRALHLIHQHVRGRLYLGSRGMQEHLTRKLDYSRDLYIRRLSRQTDGKRDVLPEDIGLTSQGEGRQLSVTQLTKLGREAACAANYREPTSKSAIKFGLYEAAKLSPLDVEIEKVPALVRAALFDTESLGAAPSAELIDIVKKRFWKAVRKRESNTSDAFYKWFSGPNNSLIKQIAQQKSKEGGRLRREDVRRVLLHLGFGAYEYLGPCIHALMRTIKNSIPQPLNEQEKRLFEHMHESQPYYGNLPAAMLAERMEDIQRAVLAIWAEPHNQEHVRVLHRLLYYYEEMARQRRQADAQSKKRRNGRGKKNTPPKPEGADSAGGNTNKGTAIKNDAPTVAPAKGGESEFIENLHGAVYRNDDPFPIIAEHIRALRAIECPAGCLKWEYYREGESDTVVKIRLRCECGQVDGAISMSLDEFAEQGEKVMGWKRREPRDSSTDGQKADGES